VVHKSKRFVNSKDHLSEYFGKFSVTNCSLSDSIFFHWTSLTGWLADKRIIVR
jgi:hypothetical protein